MEAFSSALLREDGTAEFSKGLTEERTLCFLDEAGAPLCAALMPFAV